MGVHIVQAGETLSSIAARYGTSYQILAQLNGISNPNVIHVGQRLQLPGSTGGGAQLAPSGVRFLQPVPGSITPNFGQDRGTHAHGGVDIAAPCGTPIKAAAAGRVTVAHFSQTAGNMVRIDHGGGVDTQYFHLSRYAVAVGANVAQGQTIGYVGSTGRSTGCHLHWEVRRNGQPINPLTALAGGVTLPSAGGGSQLPAETSGAAGSNAGALLLGLGLFVFVMIVARR